MAEEALKVYASGEEMIAGVSKESGIPPEDVRKVLRASFASTKDFILQELAAAQAEAQGAGKKGSALSDEDLKQVAGGVLSTRLYSSPGLDAFARQFDLGSTSTLLRRIGAMAL